MPAASWSDEGARNTRVVAVQEMCFFSWRPHPFLAVLSQVSMFVTAARSGRAAGRRGAVVTAYACEPKLAHARSASV